MYKKANRTLCKVLLEIHGAKCYTYHCQEGKPERQKRAARATGRQKGGKPMKKVDGTWYYQGRAYESLKAALEAAWPKK